MTQLHAEESAVIDAPPSTIYAILADYRNGHPHILPKQYFPDLQVEAGGYGAGTIFRVRTRALGVEKSYHMTVSEPEPGRVLVETDSSVNLVTTFTVEPEADGQKSRLTIAMDWAAQPGLGGWIEKLLTPPVIRHIYRTEMAQLASYVQHKHATQPTS